MKQEKYLEKVSKKLKKEFEKYSETNDFFFRCGVSEDKIPYIQVMDRDGVYSKDYSLASEYITYLVEDVSVADSFKDKKKEIVLEIVEYVNSKDISVPVLDEDAMENDDYSELEDDFEEDYDEEEPYDEEPDNNYSLDDEEEDPELTCVETFRRLNDSEKQDFLEDYDTDFEDEFCKMMKAFFDWKEPSGGFSIVERDGSVFLIDDYLVENTNVEINLTQGNRNYQTNSESFLQTCNALYDDYKEKIALRVLNQSVNEMNNPEQDDSDLEYEDDEEDYDDDYFPY